MLTKRLIIVLLPVLVLFLSQCAEEQPETVTSAMAGQFALLPDSGYGLLYINVKEMTGSIAVERLFGDRFETDMNDSRYKEFLDETGLDIRKDITEVYIALLPHQRNDGPFGLALVKGKFDRERLTRFMETTEDAEDIEVADVQGTRLYRFDHDFSLAVLDSETIVAGTPEYVRKNIRTRNKASSSVAAGWIELAKPAQYKSGIFMAFDMRDMRKQIDEKMGRMDKRIPLQSIRSVERIHVSMKCTDHIFFHARSSFDSDEMAELFFDAMKGALATLKLSVSNERSIVDILNKVHMEHDGSTVIVRLNLSPAEFDTLRNREDDFLLTFSKFEPSL